MIFWNWVKLAGALALLVNISSCRNEVQYEDVTTLNLRVGNPRSVSVDSVQAHSISAQGDSLLLRSEWHLDTESDTIRIAISLPQLIDSLAVVVVLKSHGMVLLSSRYSIQAENSVVRFTPEIFPVAREVAYYLDSTQQEPTPLSIGEGLVWGLLHQAEVFQPYPGLLAQLGLDSSQAVDALEAALESGLLEQSAYDSLMQIPPVAQSSSSESSSSSQQGESSSSNDSSSSQEEESSSSQSSSSTQNPSSSETLTSSSTSSSSQSQQSIWEAQRDSLHSGDTTFYWALWTEGRAISRWETTVKQFAHYTGANTSIPSQSLGLPARQVSIYQAMLFCNELTKRSGNPSDTFYVYSGAPDLDLGYFPGDVAVQSDTISVELGVPAYRKGYRLPKSHEYLSLLDFDASAANALLDSANPARVGTREPTAMGLYDLRGNVAEWAYDSPGGAGEDSEYPVFGNAYQVMNSPSPGQPSDLKVGFRLIRVGNGW